MPSKHRIHRISRCVSLQQKINGLCNVSAMVNGICK